MMHQTFWKCKEVGHLYDKYCEAEGRMFDELHVVMMMDTGKSDLHSHMEKLNMRIAPIQRLAAAPFNSSTS